MSAPISKTDILFEQRVLACAGLYTGLLDGLWGAKSEKAAQDFQQLTESIKQNLGTFDTRSEKNIATLLPEMQKKARQILKIANDWGKPLGVTCQVLSGTRTYAEQNVLFDQRPKVTNARGGSSNHNFGIAIDLGLFKGMHYFTGTAPSNADAKAKAAARAEEQAYLDLAKAVKAGMTDIDWGGDWRSFKDTPHYEYATGLSISKKRAKFEAGNLILGKAV